MEPKAEFEVDNADVIYSNPVRAGRRTYFFDVKKTRAGEYFISVTESLRKTKETGENYYERHKIYLFKEDFTKFANGVNDVIKYVEQNQPQLESEKEFEDL